MEGERADQAGVDDQGGDGGEGEEAGEGAGESHRFYWAAVRSPQAALWTSRPSVAFGRSLMLAHARADPPSEAPAAPLPAARRWWAGERGRSLLRRVFSFVQLPLAALRRHGREATWCSHWLETALRIDEADAVRPTEVVALAYIPE